MPHLTLPSDFRRVRDFGQLFNAVFEFLRGHGRTLGKHLLFIVGPVILLTGLVGYFITQNIQRYGTMPSSGSMNPLMVFMDIMPQIFIQILLFSMSYIAMMGIINEYVYSLENEPENAGVVSVIWRNFSSRLGRHVANVIVPGLVSTLPMFVFAVVLGIGLSEPEVMPVLALLIFFIVLPLYLYLVIVLSIFPVVRVQENTGVVDGIKRCFNLMKGFFWRSFGFFFVLSIIQIVLSMVFRIPGIIVNIVLPMTVPDLTLGTSPDDGSIGIVLQAVHIMVSILSAAGSQLLYVIGISGIVFQYFNLVERKEAVGMVAKLGILGTVEGEAAGAEPVEEY
jgi:hypothetical protein